MTSKLLATGSVNVRAAPADEAYGSVTCGTEFRSVRNLGDRRGSSGKALDSILGKSDFELAMKLLSGDLQPPS
jgi:hypothetical protein